jgi:bifunctional non-homologous end joining protein LigD
VLVTSPLCFIVPAQPTLRARPPKGEAWLHEVKFDGYRCQLHKDGKSIAILSRNGIDFTPRFPSIAQALARLPAKTAILDTEIAAATARGLPDFAALHSRTAKPEDLMCWCFDILRHNALDTRALPLSARRIRLRKILDGFEHGFLHLSETFSDAEKLLAECERQGLEGIVSKRADGLYRSGKCDWIKVKTSAWREANKDRGDLFRT